MVKRNKKQQSAIVRLVQSKAFTTVSVAAVAALLGGGATYLAVTSGTSEDTAIVSMKGDTITVSDLYEASKSTTGTQQSLLNVILSRVFEAQYGDKVSDDKVTEAYNKTASSYGASFSSALAQAGLTTDSYRQQIRTTMLIEYAVEQAAKEQLTDENYQSAYENYTPDTTAIVIALSDEDTANSVLAEATADGADFASIASDNTTADQTEYTFDSASTDLPDDVKEAAFNQEEGEVSDVISVLDSSTYTYTYYIVKTTQKTEKSDNWEDYKDSLKEIILNQYKNDTSFQNQVIGEALDKANVKIKDETFADILSQYATTSSSSSDTSTSTSDSSSTESSSSGD